MIAALSRPFAGTQGDATVVVESELYRLLDNQVYPSDDGQDQLYYHIFGDKGYSSQNFWLLTPISGNNLTTQQKKFNLTMSTLRVTVENVFGKWLIYGNTSTIPGIIEFNRP